MILIAFVNAHTPRNGGDVAGGEDKVKSPNFKRFEDLCCELFLQLRDNAAVFLTLMSLMFEAGLPEVRIQTRKTREYSFDWTVLSEATRTVRGVAP
jgi:hypothetical protein